METPLLALTAARTLVFIFLIIYHGDCTFRALYIYTSKAYIKSFGLLRHIFKDIYCLKARKNLYMSMIRSTL